jgi:hypothetical protein
MKLVSFQKQVEKRENQYWNVLYFSYNQSSGLKKVKSNELGWIFMYGHYFITEPPNIATVSDNILISKRQASFVVCSSWEVLQFQFPFRTDDLSNTV